MVPVKNNKGKVPVTDGPAARTRSATRNQVPEILPAATQALRRSRAPRRVTNPDPPASSASVQRPQARSATVQTTRPTRLVLTHPSGQPESSADAETADLEASCSIPSQASTAESEDQPTGQRLILRKPKPPVTGPDLCQEIARELQARSRVITSPDTLELETEIQRGVESFREAIAKLRRSHEDLRQGVFELRVRLRRLDEQRLTPTETAAQTPLVNTPRVRTLRQTTQDIRAQRVVTQGAPGKKAAKAKKPRARKTPTATKERTAPETSQTMAETGQDRGTMASFLSEDENDAIGALVQLSQNAPIVFEGNPEDGNTSNDREATVFQPQPQSGSAQSMGAPAETNRCDQLQAYLYHQQRLVGIPPEQMISMSGEMGAPARGMSTGQGRPQGPVNRPENPCVVQFSSEGGVIAPIIPPARYEGVLPFPSFRVDLPTNEQSAAEALDLNEEIYGPSGRPDRSEERAIPTQGTEEDPGSSGAMGQEFFDDMEVDQGESSAGTTTQAGAGSIQNQHRHTTRHQRILPKPTRDSPRRRSSNTVRAARAPRHHAPKPIRKHPHNGFDILAAFTDKLEMACMLAEHLKPSDLLNLYACSKNWNAFITTYPELIILERSINQAPESAHAFPFRCYPLLCKPKPKPSPKNELGPSFPWLSMIMDRERIVQSIMQWMQRTSYEVPTGSGTAIKKLWFLMDIPDTRRRKWTIRNRQIWNDMDLFLAGLFMMQIDSALQDEDEDGNELGAMRRLLMAQKSLSVLWGVLSGEIWQSELEVVQSYIRWRYEPLRHELKMQNILGVPKAEVGLLQYEAYGRHGQTDNKLRRPDSLVLGELKRRELDIPKLYREALALDEGGPHMADDHLRWDMAIKVTIEGSGIDWRDAVNLDRPNIS